MASSWRIWKSFARSQEFLGVNWITVIRYYVDRRRRTRLTTAITRIERVIVCLDKTTTIDSLRGGAGSAAYFGVFDRLIRTEGFKFETRNRRPPTDPVNALLSFGYALLRHDVPGGK